MDDLAEKRVYADRTGAARLVVAASPGLVTVAVADGRVGEFGVARDCTPTDLAVAPETRDQLVVATDSAVLVASPPAVDGLEPTGFGPATAVTVRDARPMAAAPDGRVAALGASGWTTIGELPDPATAMAGDLIGTDAGVFRVVDGSLHPAGLAGVNDVARAAGLPLVATGTGVYELGNGWLDVLEGAFDLVSGATDGRAHAAGAPGVFARADSAWERSELPADDGVGAVAYGPRTFVVTTDGDLHIADADGWHRRSLGVPGVVGAVVL